MAKSVLELAVGTGQWDAGLKKAKSALDNFTQANGGLQKVLSTDSDKMQQFVKMMGQMNSTAKTAKGQMNDYKGTIEQLTMQYNRMTDAQKQTIGQDYLRAIDQMKQKYQGVAEEVQKINQSLSQTPKADALSSAMPSGGGLFGGGKLDGMLQVFGGNLMTKAAGMGMGFVSELGDMVKQGIELARQGEGIRLAFERLGRGDILQGLREATHGTVTDLELMKAAVKFNDFKLPLDELGTMLAFAQQKAKDTGQSVDYMVDSIVTGLGRKSLMILDNLGLSAAEVKEKMAETGDMTKAVGAIIREQMAKAGDYVETAADRATKANVELENAMTRLGETFQPLTDAANDMWTSIKVGALDLISKAVQPLIDKLTEAGRLRAQLNNINAGTGTEQTRAGKDLNTLKNAAQRYGGTDAKVEDLYNRQRARYIQQQNQAWRQSQAARQRYDQLRHDGASQADLNAYYQRWQTMEAQAKAWANVLKEYDEGAKKIMNPVKADIKTDEAEQNVESLTKKLKELQAQRKKAIAAGDTDLSKSLLKQINQTKADIKGLDGTTTTTHTKTTAEKIAWDANKTYLAATHATDNMPSVWDMYRKEYAAGYDENGRGKVAQGDDALRQMLGIGKQQFDLGKDITEKDYKKLLGLSDVAKENAKSWNDAAGAISAFGSALSSIEDPAAKVMGIVAQAVANIALTFSKSLSGTVTPWDWIAAAATGVTTMISTISAIHSATGYAQGGIVKGNSYSGDNIAAMVGGASGELVGLNAGEVVLSRAQQGNLAAQLQGGDMQNLHLEAVIEAERLRLMLTNNGRRTLRGEYVTTNFR